METREAVAQDAPFITADPGHAPADTPRGVEALTRRSRDGTWTKKLNRSYFGFKLHVKTDLRYGLIRAFKTTTASVHDSQVDLSRRGEAVYRDKGYFGVGASEGIRRHDAAWDEGRADRYLGQAAQYPHIEEEGANRADILRAQACVQGRARAGDHSAPRQGEEHALLLPVLQPDAGAYHKQGTGIGSRRMLKMMAKRRMLRNEAMAEGGDS